jgi:hypothetical protein
MLIAQVDVPFEFVVNDAALPMGSYAIYSDPTPNMLVVKNRATGKQAIAFVTVHDLQSFAGNSKLTFRQDLGRHVLHQVQREGDNHTHDIVHRGDLPELAESR